MCSLVFLLISLSMLLIGLAYYGPWTHTVAYAIDSGVPQHEASDLMMWGALAMFAGRIVLGKGHTTHTQHTRNTRVTHVQHTHINMHINMHIRT
jgi:hypothetical protein